MRSVRRHLLLGAAFAIVGVFAVLGGILYGAVRHWLVAEFDRGLFAQAQSLIAATEFHEGKPRVDFDGQQPAQFLGGPQTQYFELWQDGRPVERSHSLAGHDLSLIEARPSGRPTYRFGVLPNGREARAVAIAFEISPQKHDEDEPAESRPPADLPLTMMVARDTSHLSEALTHLAWILAAACGAALLACLGLLAWNIRRSLAPVDAIASRIAGMGRTNLADRIEPVGVPRELAPIVHRLNEMLQRLQSAFERERAFTADVAHELRTPLAGLETTLEICGSRERQPHEYQKVVRQCLRATRQMHAMVDSLLILARADAGGVPVSPSTFSLPALLEEAWRPFAERAAARDLRVTRTGDIERPIHADREKLLQVLNNLFDNAVSHANDGGAVRLSLSDDSNAVRITVANTGSRLSPDQAGLVFNRFWRGDASRTDTGTHCGLGLSITKELVHLLGGTIRAESTAGSEFVVTVELPAAPAEVAEAGRAAPPLRSRATEEPSPPSASPAIR
jgi:two-component system, OmpR family, heavy metal sensor histidine kinase CusS